MNPIQQQQQLQQSFTFNSELFNAIREKDIKESKFWKERYEDLIDYNHYLHEEWNKKYLQKIQEFEAIVEFLKHPTTPDDIQNDIVLVSSDGSTVPANETILSSRSAVFRAMLRSDMAEKKTGVVKMTDVPHNVLESFVHYLYTAEAPLDLDEHMACELLVLADKYQVNRLKCFCEDFLTPKLTKESALSRYVFSHDNNAKRLKMASASLIIQDMKEFTKSEEYHKLSRTDPQVLLGIHEAYVAKG